MILLGRLAGFLMLVVALFSSAAAGTAEPQVAPGLGAYAYAYASNLQPAGVADMTTRHSQPSSFDQGVTHDAGDRSSNSPAGCLGSAQPAMAYSHNVLPPLVKAAGLRVDTRRLAEGVPAPISSLDFARVAAEAGTSGGSGLARDALGRFASGAGGESAATAAGRTAHASYENTLGGGDYIFNRALPGGSRLRPDAVSYSERIVRALKPDNPGAISDGWRQVNGYKAYLEELTGESWTAYVDLYTP